MLAIIAVVCAAIFCTLYSVNAAFVNVNVTNISHLDWVEVSFGGLEPSQASSAWIGVFHPFDADVSMIAPIGISYSAAPWTKNAPLKYILCSQIENCTSNGGATFSFRLENAFQDCKISLFTGGITTPAVLAESERIVFMDANMPMKGHLARTQSPSEMMVVWSTRDEVPDSAVKWSLTPGGPYLKSSPATTVTHNASNLCGQPATTQGYYPPFYWHNAVIDNLIPGKDIVYYIYGSESLGIWSAEESFRASPPVVEGASHAEVHIVLTADIGVTNYEPLTSSRLNMPNADATWRALTKTAMSSGGYLYSLLLHIGDLAYSCGYLLKWETYMSRLSEYGVAKRIPYVMNQGNHERDYPDSGSGGDLYTSALDSGGECGIPTEIRFPSPTNFSTRDGGWYSFKHGPALFIMLNSEAQVAPGSQQYEFLQSTLSTVNRLATPWVLVACHRPMYYVYSKGGKIDPVFQVMEPLLLQHQVDVVVVGHVHNTYMSCPVFNGTCIKPSYFGGYDAPVHMGIGNAGVAPLDMVGNSTNTPPWVAYQASEYGYTSMRISTKELEIRYHNNETDVHHEVVLLREYPRKLTAQ